MAEDNAFDAATAVRGLQAIGREFHGRGWSLGTSSNYSVVSSRDPLELLITASGKDKSALGDHDFVRVDARGTMVADGEAGVPPRAASAETLLHCMLASVLPDVGAVLHTHSVWGTMLSGLDASRGSLRLEGYEMLKGLEGIRTHETFEEVPIFPNSQDIADLAARIRRRFLGPEWTSPGPPPFHGFLLARHGLYTWGRDLQEARRHIEIYEFLFEVVGRTRSLSATTLPVPGVQPPPATQSAPWGLQQQQ
jgi:methylthioribulose-1-phosphate dehydratase